MNTGGKIGHYIVGEKLGAGGMGEVYRATDTKLGRDVALKVLPEAFTADAQRMQRFDREAQLLAALNHPNIAAIYGLEDAGSHRALVMELVGGLTLAERIAAGALPAEEALHVARQIAEALEYAHDRGIIHRDLKPANVKLTPDGAVKVLDFGLAKAIADDAVSSLDLANSPTLSLAATKAGVILGTAAYMSPEQAKGKPVDRRADIWSFGVVLYEMLTGAQLYTGETVSETMAHVITQTPNLDSLPASTPPRIRHLLQRCLTKDPRARLRDIGEARIAIEQAIANPADASSVASAGGSTLATPAAAPQPLWQRALPWALAATLGVAALLASWKPWQSPPAPPAPVRLSAEIGADANLILNMGASAVISPDGRRVVFVASPKNQPRRLYLRAMDQLEATELAGTENARHPFFSPDSAWIAFFADGKLKKIAASGGAAVTLCDAAEDRGGSWGEDGTIVFAGLPGEGLLRVSAAGGKPEPLTQLDTAANHNTHRWPQVLPGGKAVLFLAHNQRTAFDQATILVYEYATKKYTQVLAGGSYPRYAPSGHVTYVHDGTLFALPFDLQRLQPTGEPSPVVENVTYVSGNGGAQYSFSDRGDLIFTKGGSIGEGWLIQWLNQKGVLLPLRSTATVHLNPAFSPDGTRLAIQIFDKQHDIHLYDWNRDTLTRLTFSTQGDLLPSWTPDGRWVSFASDRDGPPNLYMVRSDGTGEPVRLVKSPNPHTYSAWHPSGKFLVYTERNTQANGSLDLMLLPVQWDPKEGPKPGTPSALLATNFNETTPAFSPDGRWLAYSSNESGVPEVFVRPFPAGEGKWQVSTAGGVLPVWSRTANEIFYRGQDSGRVMVAGYRATGSTFQADKPRVWSEVQTVIPGTNRNFDLHPDGKRLAILRGEDAHVEAKFDKIVIVQHFFDELRRIAPPAQR